MANTEKVALINRNIQPTYAFESSIMRSRKRQMKQFQCCIFIIILFGIVSALLITITNAIRDLATKSSTDESTVNLLVPDAFYLVPKNCSEYKDCMNTGKYQEAIGAVKSDVADYEMVDKLSPKLDVDSASYRHQMVTATSNKSLLLSKFAYVEELATKHYQRNHQLNQKDPICADVSNFALCGMYSNVSCSKYAKYRSYDGLCNNLEFGATRGVAYKPFRRILRPDYADGISQPRAAKDGTALPSARMISTTIHRSYYRNDPKFTVMLAVWGQFLDHDVTATALSRKVDGNSISCCAESSLVHPECFPVPIPVEDSYYRKYNITCMEFVRSAPAPTCCLGPRQQINQVSSYIDGSVVYGSDECIVVKLRSKKNGQLKMYVTNDNRTLLPVSDDLKDGCNREDQQKLGRYCFMSGDARANENLHLTSMHLIWARQHNLLAANLFKLNPHWNDERIFQEARHILAAQIQHITFNEFLPILLGEKLMREHSLYSQKEGYFHGYDSKVDASIANSFASATFRFAHSLIPSLIHFIGKDTSNPDYVKLHQILFDPFLLFQSGELDKLLRGATNSQMQANDQFFSPELKHHLFERNQETSNAAKTCGLDLVSLNIQRGRDHGLPGYVNWRESCSLSRPRTFNQLAEDIDADSLNYIQSVYRHVEDIDLYTGALSENPVEDSILGPTLNCLILDQFTRLKRGDRFWHENPGHFSHDQLAQIRKTTLAEVLCENSDGLQEIQHYVMRQRKKGNDNVKCQVLIKNGLNLLPWKEKKCLPHVAISTSNLAIEKL